MAGGIWAPGIRGGSNTQVSRRNSICSAAGVGAVALGVDVQPLIAQARTLKTSKTTGTRSNCPKGASLQQDCVNERRLTKPKVRRPGKSDWEDIAWNQALDEIARKVKEY